MGFQYNIINGDKIENYANNDVQLLLYMFLYVVVLMTIIQDIRKITLKDIMHFIRKN
jgi:hypothetical protein